MAVIIRIVIIVAIIYICIKLARFLLDPKRKLDEAIEKGTYYFYDDTKDVRKNFFISYNGAVFEGEKYLGTAGDSFEVISIFVHVLDTMKLQGFTKDDFIFLEKEIQLSYPNAKIDWANPISNLMK